MLPLEERARLEVVRPQLVQPAALLRVRHGEELELGAELGVRETKVAYEYWLFGGSSRQRREGGREPENCAS